MRGLLPQVLSVNSRPLSSHPNCNPNRNPHPPIHPTAAAAGRPRRRRTTTGCCRRGSSHSWLTRRSTRVSASFGVVMGGWVALMWALCGGGWMGGLCKALHYGAAAMTTHPLLRTAASPCRLLAPLLLPAPTCNWPTHLTD